MNLITENKTKDQMEKIQNPKPKTAIELEEERLKHISGIEDFDMFHERHRIFPALFENREHKNILDISAGVGAAADRINKYYDADLICNEITPKCLESLHKLGLKTVSFDLDAPDKCYLFNDEEFDAIVSLATIEHLYNIDHFFHEVRRILKKNGFIYISVPNYNGLNYLIPLLFTGKTFHDPLNPKEKYEFYGHLRYFTYRSLIKYVSSFGFTAEAVYLGKPEMGTRYLRLKSKSQFAAAIYKLMILFLYHSFSPRWAPEPVVCFRKSSDSKVNLRPKKVVL